MSKRVRPQEAAALLRDGWRYVDVRSVPEFEAGHPPGAVNVPLLHAAGGRMLPNPDFQTVMESSFPKDARLVIGCKAGGRSLQAAALLEAVGYTQLADMRGGFGGERDAFGRVACAGWAEEGLPVEAQPAPGCSYADLERRRAGG